MFDGATIGPSKPKGRSCEHVLPSIVQVLVLLSEANSEMLNFSLLAWDFGILVSRFRQSLKQA
jgi:hypothetical protein